MGNCRAVAILIVNAAVGLAACGGGSGGGSGAGGSNGGNGPGTPPPAPVPTNAGGIWEGSTFVQQAGTTYETAGAIAEDNGQARFVTDDGMHFVLSGFAGTDGDISATVTAFAASGMTFSDGNKVTNGTLSGSVTERVSMDASWSLDSGESGTISLAYNNVYERGADVARLVGTWTDSDGSTFSVDDLGGLTGQDGLGCIVNGAINAIDAAFNVYGLAFELSGCPGANGDYSGLGVLGDSTGTNDQFVWHADNGEVVFSASADAMQPRPKDTESPVITLLGDDPQILEVGGVYTELGATASDNVDGDLSNAVQIDASPVDTSMPGQYTVTYDVVDSAGNAAATVTRSVVVKDTTPPVITLLGANPQVILVGNAYTELGASAADNFDGDISAAIEIDSTAVDTSAVGTYLVTYNATDSSGNPAATVTRQVDVQRPVDITPPGISLLGDNPLIVEAGTEYVEAGATAADDVDGNLSGAIFVDASAVNVLIPGQYAVTYSVVDSSGNSAETTRVVFVQDTTAPEITLLGENPQIIFVGDPYTELGATATDIVDGNLSGSIIVDASSVNTNVVGDYLVAYNVSDAAGNSAVTIGRTVRVEDPPMPSAPSLSVEGDIKTLVFSWSDAEHVDVYKLNAITAGQIVQVGDDIASDTTSVRLGIAVHFFDFEGTQYELEACNRTGCARSSMIAVEDLRDSTIGYFKRFDSTSGSPSFQLRALSGSGKVLVGSVEGGTQVYRSIDGAWQADTMIPGQYTAVAISHGGNVMAVQSGSDKTLVFSRQGDAYESTAEIDAIGITDMSADGRTLVIGNTRHADDAGAVYVFRLQGGQWRETAMLVASNADSGDRFGSSLSLSADGNVLVVAAKFEQSTAAGIDGDQHDNSSPYGEGAAYIFEVQSNEWVQTTYFKDPYGDQGLGSDTSNDFAIKVELSGDGHTLAIGNPGFGLPSNGSVHVYRKINGQWEYKSEYRGTGDCFNDGSRCANLGEAISLSADGSMIALGCQYCDPNDLGDSVYEDIGIAYLQGPSAGQNAGRILAPNYGVSLDLCTDEGAYPYCGNDFGESVAISADGQTLVIGSGDLSSATGIGGDWSDASRTGGTAVFMY